MFVASLQSGSNGNCFYVEAGGVELLFDAGISGIRAESRLKSIGRTIKHVDALLISHDHGDHVQAAGVFQRKFNVPMHVTAPTLEAAMSSQNLGRLGDIHFFHSGQTFRIGRVTIETIPTAHDAADGVGFVIQVSNKRLGILTDLGHVTPELKDILPTLDAVIIESNFDPGMLADSSYPPFVRRRISGPNGHLSNEDSAQLVAQYGHKLQWVCLAHLSSNNNTPELAYETHDAVHKGNLPIHVAPRTGVSPKMEL